jgi:hypothetical protein
MPKLRASDTERLNIKELEEATYEETQFDTYDGEVPPNKTRLHVFVKKMWWTETNDGNTDMLKALIVADGNTREETAEYEGLTIWENMALGASSKFRWAPFLENFGLTIRDVKTKTFVTDPTESNGSPITKIGNWEVGSDDAYATIIVKRDRDQSGEWRANVGTWLPWEGEDELQEDGTSPAEDQAEPDEDLEEEDLEEEEEFEDEDEELGEEEEEEEDEEEPDPAPPPRRQRASARPAPTRAAPARSAPARTERAAPARATRTARSAPAKPASAPARGGRAARPAPAAKPKPAAAPARGRRARGSADEPPF